MGVVAGDEIDASVHERGEPVQLSDDQLGALALRQRFRQPGAGGMPAVLDFRRGRLLMVSPDSQAIACPLSGRNSTYRPVQISGAGSLCIVLRHLMNKDMTIPRSANIREERWALPAQTIDGGACGRRSLA